MALQGTIDAVPITDVLGLIGSSQRSGHLMVDGDRGSDSIWIVGGSIVGVGAAGASALGTVTNLLRHSSASFHFEPGNQEPAHRVEAVPLDVCVHDASEVMDAWRAVEAVVPTMTHRVALAPSIAADVAVTPSEWTLVVLSSTTPTIVELAQYLGLDDFDISSEVAALVGTGLLEVLPPVLVGSGESPAAAVVADPFPEHFPIDDLLVEPASEAPVAWATSEPAGDPGGAGPASTFVDPVPAPAADSSPFEPGPVSGAFAASDEAFGDGTDEVLRQMSRLSPEAADAIAAALGTEPTPGDLPSDPASEVAPQDAAPVSYLQSF